MKNWVFNMSGKIAKPIEQYFITLFRLGKK